MKISVFLSHRWAEGEHKFAKHLSARLLVYGDMAPILDQSELMAGEDIQEWMNQAVADSDVVIFIVSPSSLESPNCQFEIERAKQKKKPIIPLLLRNADLPDWLKKIKYVNCRNQEEKSLPFFKMEEIVEAIRHHYAKSREKHGQADRSRVSGISAVNHVHGMSFRLSIDDIPAPKDQQVTATTLCRLSIQNRAFIPAQVEPLLEVVGEGVRFGPDSAFRFSKFVDVKAFLKSASPTSRNRFPWAFPLTVTRDYVSGSAVIRSRVATQCTRQSD